MVDDRPPRDFLDTRPVALRDAWGASAKQFRDERARAEPRKPNGAGEHVDMPTPPPDRAPPIG